MENKKIELIANISLTVIGLVFGTIFILLEEEDPSMVFFSISLTSILYQFFGGIESNNSFKLGAIKFGGSTAVLFAFLYFFENKMSSSVDYNRVENISTDNWIPISLENGEVLDVNIPCRDTTKPFPIVDYKKKRMKHEYLLSERDNNKYNVVLKTSPNEPIGYVEIDNIEGVFKNVVDNIDEKTIQIFTLYPDDENMNSTEDLDNVKLPFEIELFKKSRFKIVEKNKKFSLNPNYNNQEVVKRSSYVVNYPHCFYIVFLEQADSEGRLLRKRYSKWLVKKFDKLKSNKIS